MAISVAQVRGNPKEAAELIGVLEAEIDCLRLAMREAVDLLTERTLGSPARSPAHNARLTLEVALNQQLAGDRK